MKIISRIFEKSNYKQFKKQYPMSDNESESAYEGIKDY